MPEALLQLGNLAYSRGDYKQALDDVERYLAVNPPSAEILWLGFRTQANVLGIPGVAALIAAARHLPFTFGVCASSCVPASIDERGRASAR